MQKLQHIDAVHLFPGLYKELFSLLDSLRPEDWERPTMASGWTVRDVTAHLLDIDIRRLSAQRDVHTMPEPESSNTGYTELVEMLNRLNAEWTIAARRMSPRIIVDFLKVTGPEICELFELLDPDEEAIFSVVWAGEESSPNWFDVAREYTERWHHQHQIRDAVRTRSLTDALWIRPYLDTLVRGLPHAYRSLKPGKDLRLVVDIDGKAGGAWTLAFEKAGWKLYAGKAEQAETSVRLPADTAWKLFSKMIPPDEARKKATITGVPELAEPLFGFVGFMV